MMRCWRQAPEERPDFKQIHDTLKALQRKMNPQRKTTMFAPQPVVRGGSSGIYPAVDDDEESSYITSVGSEIYGNEGSSIAYPPAQSSPSKKKKGEEGMYSNL